MPSYGLPESCKDVKVHVGTYAMPCNLAGRRKFRPKKERHCSSTAEFGENASDRNMKWNRTACSLVLVPEEEDGAAVEEDWKFVRECSESVFKRQKSILLDKCDTIISCHSSLYFESNERSFEGSDELVRSFEHQRLTILSKLSQFRDIRSRQEMKADASVSVTSSQLCTSLSSSEHPNDDIKKSKAVERFEYIASKAKSILDSYEETNQSREPRLQAIKLKLRMMINKKILQIANSRNQISIVTFGLIGVLNEAWGQYGPKVVSYIVVIIAQKILDQAETQVCLHTPSAFPIAQVIVDISSHQQAVLYVLVYLMMKRCPYAIPRYVEKDLYKSEEDYKIASGYLFLDGRMEGDQAYTERMGGILNLLGAIIQTSPSTGLD